MFNRSDEQKRESIQKVLKAIATKDRIEKVVGYALRSVPHTIDERSAHHPVTWSKNYDFSPVRIRTKNKPYHKVVAKRLKSNEQQICPNEARPLTPNEVTVTTSHGIKRVHTAESTR